MFIIMVFLDMVGLSINGSILVTRSYKDDGIFFLIFLVVFTLFVFKEKVGKYFLLVWLFMWFLTQFLFH